MNVDDLKRRVRRLGELTRGLAREVALWKGGNDPLLYLERKAYLVAIQGALSSIETARTLLARASKRLENEPPRHREHREKTKTEKRENE